MSATERKSRREPQDSRVERRHASTDAQQPRKDLRNSRSRTSKAPICGLQDRQKIVRSQTYSFAPRIISSSRSTLNRDCWCKTPFHQRPLECVHLALILLPTTKHSLPPAPCLTAWSTGPSAHRAHSWPGGNTWLWDRHRPTYLTQPCGAKDEGLERPPSCAALLSNRWHSASGRPRPGLARAGSGSGTPHPLRQSPGRCPTPVRSGRHAHRDTPECPVSSGVAADSRRTSLPVQTWPADMPAIVPYVPCPTRQ